MKKFIVHTRDGGEHRVEATELHLSDSGDLLLYKGLVLAAAFNHHHWTEFQYKGEFTS